MITAGVVIPFSAAHRLPKHPGMCARVHGHNYRVEIEVGGNADETGAVIWFETIDEKVGGWIRDTLDHRLIVSPDEDQALLDSDPHHVVCPHGDPTAENFALWIGEKATELLAPHVVMRVRSYEIHGFGECWAEWRPSP